MPEYNPNAYYPGYGNFSSPYGMRGNSVYDTFQPQVFTPEFVGKPVENYESLLSTLNERNQSIADTVDTIDIALSNWDMMDQDVHLLNDAKDALKSSITDISNAEDYSKVDALLRKTYRDFAGNQGLIRGQQNKQKFNEYKSKLQSLVGTNGFTDQMAQNAIRMSKDTYVGLQYNPDIDYWSGDFRGYQPAEYVDIGKMLDQFGKGFEENAYGLAGATLSEDGKWIIKSGSQSRELTFDEVKDNMKLYITQEPGVLEYLKDRFNLTSYNNAQFESEDDKNKAQEFFVDKVLDNYLDAYANKYSFSQVATEQDLAANPNFWNEYEANKEAQNSNMEYGFDVSISLNKTFDNLSEKLIRKDRVYNEPLSFSSQYATGVSSGFRAPATVKKESAYGEFTKEELTTIANIGNKYFGYSSSNSKNPGGYTDQQLANIKDFVEKMNNDFEINHPINSNIDITDGFQATLFRNKTNDQLYRNAPEKGVLPGDYTRFWYFDPETGETYQGNSKQFKNKVVDDLEKNAPLQVLGKYDPENVFTVLTGKQEFANAYKVRFGDKTLITSGQITQKTPVDVLKNAMYNARFLPEVGGVEVDLTNIGFPIKGKLRITNDNTEPFVFTKQNGTEIKAESSEQLIYKIAQSYQK